MKVTTDTWKELQEIRLLMDYDMTKAKQLLTILLKKAYITDTIE